MLLWIALNQLLVTVDHWCLLNKFNVLPTEGRNALDMNKDTELCMSAYKSKL